MTRNEIDIVRKELASVQKRMENLAVKRADLSNRLNEIEKNCVHDWSEAKKTPKKNSRKGEFYRECLKCGKIEYSSGTRVLF